MQNEFMYKALEEAKKAYKKDEVPVGAVIVKNNKIISKAHNMIEKKKNATMHAEMLVIKKATKKIKNWRLIDCEMYVTLEPCSMCKKAIELSRIKKVYYGTSKTENNQFKTIYEENKQCSCETKKIIQSFFKNKRKEKQ